MNRYEVLVNKDKSEEEIDTIRQYVKSISPFSPEFQNDSYVRFEFMGSNLDAVMLMTKGASIVSRLD